MFPMLKNNRVITKNKIFVEFSERITIISVIFIITIIIVLLISLFLKFHHKKFNIKFPFLLFETKKFLSLYSFKTFFSFLELQKIKLLFTYISVDFI